MKKVLTILMTCILLFSAIPCLAEAEPVSITFWSLFTGGDGEQMQKLVELFNAQDPNRQVTLATQDWDNYYTKLRTSIAAGESPDLAISHDVNVWGLIKEGYLSCIQDEAERVNFEFDYPNYASKLEDLKYEGKYWAIPLDMLQIQLTYNKEVLAKAGVLDEEGLPIIETGLDGFIAFIGKVEAACPEGMAAFAAPVLNGSFPWYFFNSLYYQYGGEGTFINAEGTEWTMDHDIGIKALETFQKVCQAGLPNVGNGGTDILASGAVAMAFNGAWQMNTTRTNMIGGPENFGVCKIPQFGEQYRTAMYSHTFVLPYSQKRTDEQTKLCFEFVKFCSDNNALWSEAGSVPAYLPSWESEVFQNYPMHKYFKDAVEYATPLTYTGPFGLKGSTEVNEPLQLLASGELTPEQCYAELANRMNTALR